MSDWSIYLSIGYFENTDSLSYTDLSNVVFHYMVFLKITLISSDNSKLILYNLKWILADKNSWKLKTVAVMKNTMGNLLEDFE